MGLFSGRIEGYKIDIKSETQAKDAEGFRYEDYMYDEDGDVYYEEDEYEEDEYEDGEAAEAEETAEAVDTEAADETAEEVTEESNE